MDVLSLLTGPLLGGLGGAVTAVTTKILDFKDAKDRRAHELSMRDKDREQLTLELQNKSEIAHLDADTQIAVKEGDIAIAAYASDRATYGESWMARWIIDPFRGVIRPGITVALASMLGWLTYRALTKGPPLSAELQLAIVNTALALATGAISYWFGMRGLGGRPR
jgi:hypothetical protein